MTTQVEEQQARDFLKRAEIRTMKKDLRVLREKDALKERDKIAKIKTLEEQLQELQEKQGQEIPHPQIPQAKTAPSDLTPPMPPTPPVKKSQIKEEKDSIREVLQKNQTEERLAEKNLKNYATEQERQQIFLLESQRLNFENQIDTIEKQKEPSLKLDKNKLMIQKRGLQDKLNPISEKQKKLEGEESILVKESAESNIPSQKKSLEQRRWDIEKEIQKNEKRRWSLEKQIQDIDKKIQETDKFLIQLVTEKNNLQGKVLGADKSLRDIYSGVISRVEERRRGEATEQKTQREQLQKTRAGEKETVQREQWRGVTIPKKKEFLRQAPENFKEKLAKTAATEEEQRKKFLQNVENWSEDKK